MRGGRYIEGYAFEDLCALARAARGADPFGYRGEFLQLVGLARSPGQAGGAVAR